MSDEELERFNRDIDLRPETTGMIPSSSTKGSLAGELSPGFSPVTASLQRLPLAEKTISLPSGIHVGYAAFSPESVGYRRGSQPLRQSGIPSQRIKEVQHESEFPG